jgi:hypothetical protein
VTEEKIRRQQLLLMRALARPGAAARWSRSGNERVLMTAPQTNGGGGAMVPDIVAQQALSAGLIAAPPGSQDEIVLTPAGKAWLKRQLASDDPFLSQHRELREVARPPAPGQEPQPPLVVNDAESPLAWLRQRRARDGAPILSDPQYAAGERLRQDYTFAALGPRVTANWSNMAPTDRQARAGSSAGELRDDVIAAKSRVGRALHAVGPELGRMLMDVCCLLKGVETAEAEQGLPKRSGKVVLQLALTALARHYGLIAPPPPMREAMHILQWGAADYRPTIDGN